MPTSPIDTVQYLPHGEMVRCFALQPTIGKGELDNLLRKRGVFAGSSDKEDTVPYLASTLMSADEFAAICEAHKTREDKPKLITQMIEWTSPETLQDSVPESLWTGMEDEFSFSNFDIRRKEEFFAVDGNPDHLQLEFEIERRDRSKNWVESESWHKGTVEVKKIVDAGRVKIAIAYTAKETADVARKATARVISHFKTVGAIEPDRQVEKVLFSTFDNRSRVGFLLDLTSQSDYASLKFKEIIDFSIAPISADEMPATLSWIEEQVKHLRLRGASLQSTRLLSETDCHDYIEMYNVKARFEFDVRGAKGTCCVSIGFPGRGTKDDEQSDLEVMVDDVKLLSKGQERTSSAVKTLIEQELQERVCMVFRGRATAAGVAGVK